MKTHATAVSAIVAEIQGLCHEARIDEKAHRGPVAVYQPSFIVTLLILKNLYGFSSERSFLRFVASHHRDLFPIVPDHSWFNRKAKRLSGTQTILHQRLLHRLGCQLIDIRIVDTTPVPVVKLHRARHCRSFRRKTEVNHGYCASKKLYYYGQKLTLLVTPEGIPTNHLLSPGNFHDVRVFKEHLRDLRDIAYKRVVADKGYYDGELAVELKKRYRTRLVVPDKKRHQKKSRPGDKRLLRKRSIIETVTNQLQDHMHIDATRAKSALGLVSRIRAAILAFVFGCYFNLLHGQAPLALKSMLI